MIRQEPQLEKLNYLNLAIKNLSCDWQNFFVDRCLAELEAIDGTLIKLSETEIIYPPRELIFNALYKVPLHKVRVVILGQDPYHGDGEANGLSFAVNKNVKLPPSLRNIYKELAIEYNLDVKSFTGEHLANWASQGVLLLNSTLTVIKDRANSLATIGWENVTNKIIKEVSIVNKNVVFILWGAFAKQKLSLIDLNKHLVLSAAHPSPLSAHRGFFGCNHFILTNQYLDKNGYNKINW